MAAASAGVDPYNMVASATRLLAAELQRLSDENQHLMAPALAAAIVSMTLAVGAAASECPLQLKIKADKRRLPRGEEARTARAEPLFRCFLFVFVFALAFCYLVFHLARAA